MTLGARVAFLVTLLPQLEGAVPEIRVMTVKLDSRDWRVLETEELDVIWEAMRRIGDRGR